MATVPITPKISPPYLNAKGMAMMPVPRDPLIRCIKVPTVLEGVLYLESQQAILYIQLNLRVRISNLPVYEGVVIVAIPVSE